MGGGGMKVRGRMGVGWDAGGGGAWGEAGMAGVRGGRGGRGACGVAGGGVPPLARRGPSHPARPAPTAPPPAASAPPAAPPSSTHPRPGAFPRGISWRGPGARDTTDAAPPLASAARGPASRHGSAREHTPHFLVALAQHCGPRPGHPRVRFAQAGTAGTRGRGSCALRGMVACCRPGRDVGGER